MPLLSRRTFLHGLGFTASHRLLAQPAALLFRALPDTLATGVPRPADSKWFGIGPEGRLLDRASLYTVPRVMRPQDRLCFDISNNRVSCSINARGLPERFALELGVAPIETHATPVGAYVDKQLHRFGPLVFTVSVGDATPSPLDQLPQPEVYLQDNLFPRYEWTLPSAKLSMLAFAPEALGERPRAICFVWTAQPRTGSAPAPVTLHLSEDALKAFHAEAGGVPFLLQENGRGWSDAAGSGDFSTALRPGEATSVALVLGTEATDLQLTKDRLVQHTAKEWLSLSGSYHRDRYGELTISEAPFFADLYTRAAELCRQSLMIDTEGNFGGSFNGSDLPAVSNVWMRDCFYATLPQSFLAPDLCASAILFFLRRSIPSHALGEHADKFPHAGAVTNSLGNSVAGLVLAGAYYAHSADKRFFLAHPEILSRSIDILEQVLASRREDVFLFPSIYVSDGESRGDFHTGSNIFLWRAICNLARLAREIYEQPATADRWQDCAERLRAAIEENCVSTRDGKSRFVEGAMQDRTQISGHDGEESDVTLASFYGFCESDDPRYLGAAQEAMSTANPYFFPEMEGIWWHAHGKWSSATFPGWITALAASQDEQQMVHHIERIRALTDADGSFWWWPYPHTGDLHVKAPARVNSKCAWAAGTFLCYITHQLFGLGFDAPTDRLRFAPFSPWSFAWKGCRLGRGLFDCSYRKTENEVVLTVRNRTARFVTVSLRATLPANTELEQPHPGNTGSRRYGRACVQKTDVIASQQESELRVRFRPILA